MTSQDSCVFSQGGCVTVDRPSKFANLMENQTERTGWTQEVGPKFRDFQAKFRDFRHVRLDLDLKDGKGDLQLTNLLGENFVRHLGLHYNEGADRSN